MQLYKPGIILKDFRFIYLQNVNTFLLYLKDGRYYDYSRKSGKGLFGSL